MLTLLNEQEMNEKKQSEQKMQRKRKKKYENESMNADEMDEMKRYWSKAHEGKLPYNKQENYRNEEFDEDSTVMDRQVMKNRKPTMQQMPGITSMETTKTALCAPSMVIIFKLIDIEKIHSNRN